MKKLPATSPKPEVLSANLAAALAYAGRGWHVFPIAYVKKDGVCSCSEGANCKSKPGKHPMTKGGFLDASKDPAIIRRWWTENRFFNIGLATGIDGLVVVDVDVSLGKDGQPKQGAANLATLEQQYSALPETLRCITGSGGKHYYFYSKHEISNSQNKIAKDIDVRGKGGYVILPPSNHASGNHYHWDNEGSSIPEMPDWLAARAMGSRKELAVSNIDISGDTLQPSLVKEVDESKLSDEQVVRLLDFIPADCDRDTWWRIGAILKVSLGDKKGFAVWRAWSLKYPDPKRGWDETDGITQWNSFEDRGLTVGSLVKMAKELGNFRGFDREAADSPELKEKWIFVVGIKRFVERERLLELDAEQFSAQFAPMFTRGKAADHVLRNADFPRLDAPTYWPMKEEIVIENHQRKLNYYKPSGVSAKKGDVKPFLAHVDYLLPEPEESSILLDYLAYHIQYPGEKIHWAILLQGAQGNGKSFFGRVMASIVGEHNVAFIPNETLHEPYTNRLKNRMFIVVEEMMAGKRLELMNKLKPMITEPWLNMREMYKPPYELPNRFNFLFLTNHPDSILITDDDRRYCVLASKSPAHPLGPKYYKPLFDWAAENAPALAYWAGARDLKDFQPKAHAPMTEGKAELIAETRLPLDHTIKQHVEAREWPFGDDLVSTGSETLMKFLNDSNLRSNPKEVGRSFGRLGYLQLGRQRLEGGPAINFWAVRNFETYTGMSAGQLRLVWQAQINNSVVESPEIKDSDLIAESRALREKKPM